MTWNNLVLLALWGLLAWRMGPLLFVAFYLVSASLAGGAGLLLFAVQHNFEQSYASGNEGWDYTRGAIEGTSFLQPARLAELVHGEHRLPPHPPPVGAHSQLLPGGLPRRIRAAFQRRQTHPPGTGARRAEVHPVGHAVAAHRVGGGRSTPGRLRSAPAVSAT